MKHNSNLINGKNPLQKSLFVVTFVLWLIDGFLKRVFHFIKIFFRMGGLTNDLGKFDRFSKNGKIRV